MRASAGDSHFRVRAIAGTHVVLMALDMDEATRQGLQGFAIKRGLAGQPQEWLRGIKYFKSTVPTPVSGADYPSRDQPFQTFLWSDYRAEPQKNYDFTVVALYGAPGNFEERHTLQFSIGTEPEDDPHHSVYFNRGIIASHAFETQFNNKPLTDAMTNNVSDDGKLLDPEVAWLSRGLAEACLKYINGTGPGEGLRVCAYEFTYPPILMALNRAHQRGVDVKIVFHDTKKPNDENRRAIAASGLPSEIVFPRTRTAIPHNKFIVKLAHGTPAQVWTGSTNFTDTGFLGQANVGHRITDAGIAKTYFDYWTELSADPVHSAALTAAADLTPNPPNVIGASSTVAFYSPRKTANMLDWYGQRIADAASLVMMTIPFNVADTILKAFDRQSDALRLVVLEDVPSPTVLAAEQRQRGKLAFSNGAILGKSFVKFQSSAGGAKVTPIANSKLDEWFVDEELARPTNSGHVFFVHAKVLLVDPLSDDPLVCSGSANFSANSLTANDENMLLVRGNTRVADIYMTEIDRIFRHFYARDVINKQAAAGQQSNPLELDQTGAWIGSNFKAGAYKNNRRLLFFPPGAATPWSVAAARDPDPFADGGGGVTHAPAKQKTQTKTRKQASGPKKKAKKSSPKKSKVKKRKTAAKTGKSKKRTKKSAAAKRKKRH